MAELRIHPETRNGDPIATAGEARRKQAKQRAQLRELEAQLRHDYLPEWGRCELQDYVGKLRKRMPEEGSGKEEDA